MNELVRKLFELEDFWVEARNVLFEAMSEPDEGKLAVACVVLNRMQDPRWPDTPKGVILQPQQFSWTIKASWNSLYRLAFKPWLHFPQDWQIAKEIVTQAHQCWPQCDPTGGANHYLNVEVTRRHWGLPKWYDESKITAVIERHTFLKI